MFLWWWTTQVIFWFLCGNHMSLDMTKPTKWLFAKRRLRSTWASAQSDQSLRCPHEESLGPYLPIEHTAKTLIRLGRCPGWSESLLGAQSLCWFYHVAGQILARLSPVLTVLWFLPYFHHNQMKVLSLFISGEPSVYRCGKRLFPRRHDEAWLGTDGGTQEALPSFIGICPTRDSQNWETFEERIITSSKLPQMSRSTRQIKWPVRPAKTQISLGIHPVWSQS